jgi:uncharacterized protein YegP (UPF0339 family)
MANKRSKLIKFKRKWKGGKMFYYFKHIASNGEVIFSSPSYKTRSGRNKMVNKLSKIHNAVVKTELDD